MELMWNSSHKSFAEIEEAHQKCKMMMYLMVTQFDFICYFNYMVLQSKAVSTSYQKVTVSTDAQSGVKLLLQWVFPGPI
jgi:hypothetical protein